MGKSNKDNDKKNNKVKDPVLEETTKEAPKPEESQAKDAPKEEIVLSKAEAYKLKAIKHLERYVNGGKDLAGNTITYIYARADEYVIYGIQTKDKTSAIRVSTSPWTEEDKNKIEVNYVKIRAKYVEVKGHLYKATGKFMMGRIAQVLAHGIDGFIEEAEAQFDNIVEQINTDYKEQFKNRLRYLSTVLSVVVLLIALSILCYNYDWFNLKELNQTLIYVCTAGSIGGFISVSRRIRQMVFEKEVGSFLYVFYGLERVFISILGSIVVYFIIRSNILLGFVNELGELAIYGILVFAFVAGFSETLIPNLLIKLEKENT